MKHKVTVLPTTSLPPNFNESIIINELEFAKDETNIVVIKHLLFLYSVCNKIKSICFKCFLITIDSNPALRLN